MGKLDQLREMREGSVDGQPPAKVIIIRKSAKKALPAPSGRRVGRPRLEDKGNTLAATRPWEALGMSRRSWFRREKERRGK
jgi:hypothetical protein